MRKELIALRNQMSARGIDVYIIPTNDFHGSEYINDYFKVREFVSGFTGSAGTLVVTHSEARLWTDGRYFLQAAAQLKDSGIQLMKSGEPGVPTISDYLKTVLGDGKVLSFDGRVVSCEQGESYAEIAAVCGSSLIYDVDLGGEIWMERPALSGNPIWQLPAWSAGENFQSKIANIRSDMAGTGADYHLITGLEENAWLYNLRGSDVESTPVFFSYTLIGPDFVNLYIFDDAVSSDIIPDGVTVRNYFTVIHDLAEVPITATIFIDPSQASYSLVKAVPEGCRIYRNISPVTRFKAVKNSSEITSTKKVHVADGVAMVKFIHWLKNEIRGGNTVTEISAADYLENLRKEQEGFLEVSFSTIAGYKDNGAIVHYTASESTNKTLRPESFLLVDSGGQYLGGTTDITRTIALGPLSDKEKQYYTAVLRGHIDLAKAVWDKGTSGQELDHYAREPLYELGLDFNHGTGHGVGHVLSVHEGPQRISKAGNDVPMVPGMITSDEPGVYIEREFGVRIENEVLCVELGDKLGFETLTFCPYERDAIIPEMLEEDELAWLNTYNALIYETLAPLLNEDESNWLKDETAKL